MIPQNCRWRINTLVTSQYRTQVIKYNQHFLQVDQPIRLQYSNQIKLYIDINYKNAFPKTLVYRVTLYFIKKNIVVEESFP